MCASPVFSSAAMSRPFIFSPHSLCPTAEKDAAKKPVANATSASKSAEILARVSAISKLAAVVPASRLAVRAAPDMAPSGIPQLDSLTGGLPRGCLTEICGASSSGRTSILLFALARATQRGDVCALIDASDAFDPASAAAAGMEMSRLLWVRCGKAARSSRVPGSGTLPEHDFGNSPRRKFNSPRASELPLEQVLKVTDLLLQSNGFGMIALDLGDVPVRGARRIPLASWFRFRRAVEHTPTVLLALEQQPIAGSCSSLLLKVSALQSHCSKKLSAASGQLSANNSPTPQLLDQFEITAELLRSRLEMKSGRKPPQSTTANFRSQAAWAMWH